MPTSFPVESNPQFGLAVNVAAGVVTVTYVEKNFRQNILSGTAEDFLALMRLLTAERDRMIDEIQKDVASGSINPADVASFSDLHDQCDANIYIAGGRIDDGSWNDEKTDRHERGLLSKGLIGKGIETIDPACTAGSESFTGFQNAASHAVDIWLRDGSLAKSAAKSLGR